MKTFILILIVALGIGLLMFALVPAQPGCKSKMTWTELVNPSPPYRACDHEMKTSFNYTKDVAGLYNPIRCEVINTPFDHTYYAGDVPDQGPVVEWTHCPNLNNHQLLLDIITGNPPPGRLFLTWSLTAEYFAGQPTGPEEP